MARSALKRQRGAQFDTSKDICMFNKEYSLSIVTKNSLLVDQFIQPARTGPPNKLLGRYTTSNHGWSMKSPRRCNDNQNWIASKGVMALLS